MSAPTLAPFLFNWDPPRRRNLAITGFLIASLAAHVVCFYLFQIVYQPTASLTPAPERVNLISPNSEEGATLLSWIDSEDPALATTTRRPSDAKRYLLGKIQHVPSYSSIRPALQAAPPLNVDLRVPSAQPAGPVRTISRPPAKAIGVVPTKIIFSHELDALGQATFVAAKFQSSTKDAPQNAQFRVAVDSQGVVRYCFPLNSSGDVALDDQAREHLALSRFPARSTSTDANDLVWGIASVEWGNDVAATAEPVTSRAP
ncbi:MAG TPA: hypothetical protein VH170_04895 [Chthoniobacterales bacterium]|jgi:hypothetical protein|nr:hypothetical protein [Chthoniobacterales bacterium]